MSLYLTSNFPDLDPNELGELAQSFAYNGNLVSYATLATTLVCGGLIWTVTSQQLQSFAPSYLAITRFSRNEAIFWVLWLGVVLLITDLIRIASGSPVVPEMMQTVYGTADSKPLLWLAIIIAAPLFEELLFRGFLFQGLRRSALGGSGAVVLTAAIWALIHQQYDFLGMFSIFAIGILLGLARWRSGSLLLPFAMHVMTNLVATIQLMLIR